MRSIVESSALAVLSAILLVTPLLALITPPSMVITDLSLPRSPELSQAALVLLAVLSSVCLWHAIRGLFGAFS